MTYYVLPYKTIESSYLFVTTETNFYLLRKKEKKRKENALRVIFSNTHFPRSNQDNLTAVR